MASPSRLSLTCCLMMLGLWTSSLFAATPAPAEQALTDDATARFKLVDGNTQAVIVGDDTIASSVQNGYKTLPRVLATYIKQSTGRELQHIREDQYDPKTYPYAIFTGTTQASKDRHGAMLGQMDLDAYVVEITPHVVYLAGARPFSAGYAMLDFLESEMGIATYIPTRWGTIVPHHDSVVLKPAFRVESPVFLSRALSALRTWHDSPDKINYGANTDLPWRMYRRDEFSHAIYRYITVKEFGKTHPEYFAQIQGQRVIVSSATGPGPCISNPDVVNIISQKVIAFFDDPRNKDKDIISLGMTDGGWCECDKCQALDGPDIFGHPSKSRRYYWFLNQVADNLRKVHPDKSIGVPAYAGAEYPPANMRVARNIVVYIAQTRANWGDKSVEREQLKQTFAWSSRVNRIGIYEYLYGAGFMVPRLYSHQLANYMRQVSNQGNAGFYAEIYSNHALDGPKAWITQKLMWNPWQNVSALQTRWCQVLFNESAQPMDEYFAFLEACNTRNILRVPAVLPSGKGRESKFYLLSDENQFELFTPAEIDHAMSLLDQASQLSKRPEILERIDYFRQGLKVTQLSVRAYHALAPAREVAAQDHAPPARILAALIQGEAGMPDQDPVALMDDLVRQDASAFTPIMPVSISTATKLSMDLVNGKPWQAVYARLRQGPAKAQELRDLAKHALLSIAPENWQNDPMAKRQVDTLVSITQRIAVAHRVSTPPAIDGDVSDAAWQWQENSPWFAVKSGAPFNHPTKFAFCYDDKMLYFAFRGELPDIDSHRQVTGYGAAAWKYISSEVFLQPDARDLSPQDTGAANAKKSPPAYFQFIPALGGGMFASRPDVVKAWKVTHTNDHWQAEVALDLSALNMPVEKLHRLRLNVMHNTSESGHYGKDWFPVDHANNDPMARGWLIFEP